MAHVPFLCDIRRGTRITDTGSYREVARYLATHRDAKEQVFRALDDERALRAFAKVLGR